jgi:hypothetical protein
MMLLLLLVIVLVLGSEVLIMPWTMTMTVTLTMRSYRRPPGPQSPSHMQRCWFNATDYVRLLNSLSLLDLTKD